ncbi:MAG TPA: hypothetical protein VNK95_04585, partial [Caldilineaceae bacterium]|nr:hypothetical protein [Caldilineaceae bacterium]
MARPVAAAAHASALAAGAAPIASGHTVAGQPGDSEPGNLFFDGQFVYVPPPTPLLSTDPK